jgi:hypothetical protein
VNYFTGILQEKAKQVDEHKMKTIGLRIQVESEVEQRKIKQARIQFHISQRQAELNRYICSNEDLLHILIVWSVPNEIN